MVDVWDRSHEALGCEGWFTARVTTGGTGAYIEVVTDKYVASPLSRKMHEFVDSLYAAK